MKTTSVTNIVESNPNLKKDLNKFLPPEIKSYSVQKILNSQASRDNRKRITKMKSLQDGQGSLAKSGTTSDMLVFSRQVFNPELMFNQDKNKEDVQLDSLCPFSWQVNVASDGCYICQ